MASSFNAQAVNFSFPEPVSDPDLLFDDEFLPEIPLLRHLPDAINPDPPLLTPTPLCPAFQTNPLARKEGESNRDYTNRCARAGFGIPSLRDQQWEALEALVFKGATSEDCDDVILIAKTSFGKSLLFQLAPLIVGNRSDESAQARAPAIVLILMPLTLLLEEQANFTQGRLGARCCVLTRLRVTTVPSILDRIAQGYFSHGG